MIWKPSLLLSGSRKSRIWNTSTVCLVNEFTKFKITRKDTETWLISNKENPKVTTGWNQRYFEASGDMTRLTELSGNNMIMLFVTGMPIYNSSRSPFEELETMHIELTKSSNNKATFKGDMTFMKGAYPMNELLKFALRNKMLRLNQ